MTTIAASTPTNVSQNESVVECSGVERLGQQRTVKRTTSLFQPRVSNGSRSVLLNRPHSFDMAKQESAAKALHTLSPSTPDSTNRRESFLFREQETIDYLSSYRQRHSTLDSVDRATDDALVTPFAQLLSSLRSVRTNFMLLTDLPLSSSRRRSTKEDEANSLAQSTRKKLSDTERHVLAHETLEELEKCLDQLETIQTHRSVGYMAAHKFKQLLNRELSQHAGLSKSGQRVSDFITQTFLDNNMDDTESLDDVESATNVLDKRQHNLLRSQLKSGGPLRTIRDVSLSSVAILPLMHQDRFLKYGIVPANEQQLEEQLKQLNVWGVDLFQLSRASNNRPLTTVTYTIMQQRDLLNSLKIPNKELISYLARIEDHYRVNVPYHNSLHAADVVQSSHFLLNLPTLKNIFTDIEIFSALLAAAVHDVDHPGLNSQFLINSSSELALVYNDQSVLENHHLSVAFKLLQKEGCEALQNFGKKKYQNMRRMVIDMVLATDMCRHMEHVAQLRTRVEVRNLAMMNSDGAGANKLMLDTYNDRMEVLKGIIHCADLSNPAKPKEIYCQWTERVMEEFFRQGDKEHQLGLDISPMCDRKTVSTASAQIAFIDFIVFPLWETWASLVQPDCREILNLLVTNRDWQQTVYDSEHSLDTTGHYNSDPMISCSTTSTLEDTRPVPTTLKSALCTAKTATTTTTTTATTKNEAAVTFASPSSTTDKKNAHT